MSPAGCRSARGRHLPHRLSRKPRSQGRRTSPPGRLTCAFAESAPHTKTRRRSDERAATRAKRGAIIGGAEKVNAITCAKVARHEVDVTGAGAGEIVDCDPLLVLEA